MCRRRFDLLVYALMPLALLGAHVDEARAQGMDEQPIPRSFDLDSPAAKKLAGKKLTIAKGVELDLTSYLAQTSMKVRKETQQAFSPTFRRNFLRAAPAYQEKVEEESDRLRVTRTLTLPFKDPCDSRIPKSLSLCFRPGTKPLSKEIKADLDKTRAAIRSQLRGRRVPPRLASELRATLALDDKALLAKLINRPDEDKVITHTSVLPFASYPMDKIPRVDLSKANVRLPPSVLGRSRPRLRPGLRGAAAAGVTRRLPVDFIPPRTQPTGSSGPYTFANEQSRSEKMVLGWTIGRHVSDTFEVQFAKKTRVSDRYYARFSYTVRLGMGLRFPFELQMDSRVSHVTEGRRRIPAPYPGDELCPSATSAEEAHLCASRFTVSLSARGKDANPDFYREAGVPEDQLFRGREFVLEAGFDCQFYASIPGPNLSFECPFGRASQSASANFTPRLSASATKLLETRFSGRDLGLALDAGIGYAAINPGVRLFSKEARLNFRANGWNSNVASGRTVRLEHAGRPVTITVNEGVNGGPSPWGIRLEEPSFRLSSHLRPFLEAEIGLDLGVYEWSMTFGPYTFGSFQIDLGSFSFTPHEGTPTSYQLQLGTRKD